MEVKVVVVKALPKGLVPAWSGYFTDLIEGLGERASFAAYFELETLEGDVEFLSQGGWCVVVLEEEVQSRNNHL